MKHSMLLSLAVLLTTTTYSIGQQVLQLKDEVCQNYEETSAALQDAKAAWVDPSCYDFSYTFTGYQIGQPEPQNVRVRNGVAENGEKTMDDFFGMIESLCVEGCPDAGAGRCEIEYAIEGYPMSIFIDIDKYQPDNRRAYTIEDFAFVVCDEQQEPTDETDGPSNPEGQPQEVPEQSPVEAPVDEPITDSPTQADPVEEIITDSPTQAEPVDETITSSPTQADPVEETITDSPTQADPVEESITDSPTQAEPVEETITDSPTQTQPVEETITDSPTRENNQVDLENEERSTVILNGFRMSLSVEEENSLEDTTLAAVMAQYLSEELNQLDGFLHVRLVSMDENVSGQTGRQAQPDESRMFFGEAFFTGEAPEESVVLEIQAAALTDNTRVQEVLSYSGVNAILIHTEIYEREVTSTEDSLKSGSRSALLPRVVSCSAAAILFLVV